MCSSNKNEKVNIVEMDEMENGWVQDYTHILRAWLYASNNFNIWHVLEELNPVYHPFSSWKHLFCDNGMYDRADGYSKCELLITSGGIPALVTIPTLLKYLVFKIFQFRELLGPFWKVHIVWNSHCDKDVDWYF